MRTVYSARWKYGGTTKACNVLTCIEVSVGKPATKWTREAMFGTDAFIAANGTSLRRVRRIDVHHTQPGGLGLVLHKRLELRPGPAMQARTHTLARLDALTDVGQVLHRNCGASVVHRFRDNGFTDFVIHVRNVPGFSAGDFLQKLLCAFGAVALKTSAKIQKFIAVMTEFSASEQFSAARGGKVVLSHVQTENVTLPGLGNIGEIKNKIEKPAVALADKLGFFGKAERQIFPLEISGVERNQNTPGQGEQGKGTVTQAVGAFVKMDRRPEAKLDQRPVLFLEFWPVGQKCFIRFGYLMHGIASHLGTKRRRSLSNRVVGGMVQFDSVEYFSLNGNRNNQVAGCRESRLKPVKLASLFQRQFQFQTHRAFHAVFVSHDQGKIKKEARFLPGMNAEVSARKNR